MSAAPPPYLDPPRRSRAAAAGLHLVFDGAPSASTSVHPGAPCAASPSPSSSFSCSCSPTASSAGPATPRSPGAAAQDAEDDCWNLIPYHVPWGPEYFDYTPGSLPGPEGQCVLLRSPTPLKHKRTVRACARCRDRKAKCSGDRPACARCLARGYVCAYDDAEDQPHHHQHARRSKGPERARQRLRERSAPGPAPAPAPAHAPSALPEAEALPARCSPKREEVEAPPHFGELLYPYLDPDLDAGPALTRPSASALCDPFYNPDLDLAHPHLHPPQSRSVVAPPPSLHSRVSLGAAGADGPWAHAAHAHAQKERAGVGLVAAPSPVHAPRPVRRAHVPFLGGAPQAHAPPPMPISIAGPEAPPLLEVHCAEGREGEGVWPTDADAGAELDALVAQSAFELVHGYLAHEAYAQCYYYPVSAHGADAGMGGYYDADGRMQPVYGQGVGVGVVPAATYVPYAV